MLYGQQVKQYQYMVNIDNCPKNKMFIIDAFKENDLLKCSLKQAFSNGSSHFFTIFEFNTNYSF